MTFILLYVAFNIFADIGSLRIITIYGFSLDAGTLIFPLTFLVKDMLQQSLGFTKTVKVIIITALLNFFMVVYFNIVGLLPPDLSVGTQQEFVTLFTPIWRITLASILAETFANYFDSFVFNQWVKKFNNKYKILRANFTNIFSVLLDSIIFVTVAFYGLLPFQVVIQIFITNILIKYVLTFIVSPLVLLQNEKDSQGS